MYTIGLIDDEENQLKTIRRTIKTNAGNDEKYDFKTYLISDNATDFVEKVFEDVINDIREMKLSSLIVDYKLIVKTSKIKGTDIFKKIKDEVPKFPVIILTEVVEESTEPDFVDADKFGEHFLYGFMHLRVEVFCVREPFFARRNKIGECLCPIYREKLINCLGKFFSLFGGHVADPLIDGAVELAAIGRYIL